MDKAYTELRRQTILDTIRIDYLLDSVRERCFILLGGADDGIDRALQYYQHILDTLDDGMDSSDDAQQLLSYTSELEAINYKLALQGSCPLLY